MPDWLLPTLTLLPAALWYFLVSGLPWALIILPRCDWKHSPTVVFTALALGPTLNSLIMLIIGTSFRIEPFSVLSVSGMVFGVGALIAFRRARFGLVSEPTPSETRGWTFLEIALGIGIMVAVLLRFWNTAYWPFATYDEFWVYGYNARIFMLDRVIPNTMGYYPQNVPLAYTFMQLINGGINDHAARVAVPWFALASIGMAYLLGARLYNRRVGLLTAAIWALYPQHGVWSQFGDLEVPLALYFTATIVFFTLAWQKRNHPEGIRYGILAGMMLGGALWTKPTAGALIQSLALLGLLLLLNWTVIRRQSLTKFPFRLFIVCLLTAFPIGGIWYIRNFLLGLPPLVLPEGYWQEAAQRSGQELGWLLLIAIAITARLLLQRKRDAMVALIGLVLVGVGALPSALGGHLPTISEMGSALVGQIVPTIQPTRLGAIEYGVILAGFGLLAYSVREARRHREMLFVLVVLAAPYFVTWFWSYSYHFRLSFAIVPALILFLAAELDSITRLPMIFPRSVRVVLTATVMMLALPGWWSVLSGIEPALTGALPTDDAKYAYGNPALMNLVGFLREQQPKFNRPMRIIAPNELRLGFFFPNEDIRGNEYPTQLDQLKDIDFYIDNSAGQRVYIARNIFYNQILASRTRLEAMQRVFTTDDGNFRFSVYTVTNAARFEIPKPNDIYNVQFGDFAILYGLDLTTLRQFPGENVYLTLWWRAMKPATRDYSVFIHLWDVQNQRLVDDWGGQPVSGAFTVWQNVPGAHISVPYPTRLWQTGETIRDEWKHAIARNAPPGKYELRVGLFDPLTGERLPVIRNGQQIGDSFLINIFEVAANP